MVRFLFQEEPQQPEQPSVPQAGQLWRQIAAQYRNLLHATSLHQQRKMAWRAMPQIEILLSQMGVAAFTSGGEWNIQMARDLIGRAVDRHKYYMSRIYMNLEQARLSQDHIYAALGHSLKPYGGNINVAKVRGVERPARQWHPSDNFGRSV
jgi:hypothetical protein